MKLKLTLALSDRQQSVIDQIVERLNALVPPDRDFAKRKIGVETINGQKSLVVRYDYKHISAEELEIIRRMYGPLEMLGYKITITGEEDTPVARAPKPITDEDIAEYLDPEELIKEIRKHGIKEVEDGLVGFLISAITCNQQKAVSEFIDRSDKVWAQVEQLEDLRLALRIFCKRATAAEIVNKLPLNRLAEIAKGLALFYGVARTSSVCWLCRLTQDESSQNCGDCGDDSHDGVMGQYMTSLYPIIHEALIDKLEG